MGSAPPLPGTSAAQGTDTPPSLFRLSVDHVSGVVIVGGELDRRHRHLILDVLRTLVATPHDDWTVDLAEVTFCDTAGLQALVEGHGFADEHQRSLVLVRPSDCVRRLLRITGLEPLLCGSPPSPGGSGHVPRHRPPHPGGHGRAAGRMRLPAPA